MLSLELELVVVDKSNGNTAGVDVQLQLGNDMQVQADTDEPLSRPQYCLDVPCYLPQGSLFQPALHHPGTRHIVCH